MAIKIVDRRIQRTRRLLQNALLELILEKGFDSATVQDVIDRANVGRSTFYAHFQDKEDLLVSGFEHLRTEFEQHLSESMTSDSPWELTLSMFKHAQSQRPIYKALAGKQGGNVALSHIQRFLFTYLQTHLNDHLKQTLSKRKNSIPTEILAQYIFSSFIALLVWWLDNDSPYSAEQMNDFYRRLVQPGVEAIMH